MTTSTSDIDADRRISIIRDLASDKLGPVVAPFGFVPVVLTPLNSWWDEVIRFSNHDGVHAAVAVGVRTRSNRTRLEVEKFVFEMTDLGGGMSHASVMGTIVHSVFGIEDTDALTAAVGEFLKATDFALDPTSGEANARSVLRLHETIWVYDSLTMIEGISIVASVTEEGEMIEARLGDRTARFVMVDGQAWYDVDGGPTKSIVGDPDGHGFEYLTAMIVEEIFRRRTLSPAP